MIVTTPSAGEGQMNRPRFQPLHEQAHALGIMPEDLDQITAPAAEDKEMARVADRA